MELTKAKKYTRCKELLQLFYDAKDKVTEAKAQSENTSAANKMFAKDSVESYALQAVLAEERTKKLETQLKRMFQDKGKTALYSQMMRVRQLERSRRLQAAKAAAKRKKRIADLYFFISYNSRRSRCNCINDWVCCYKNKLRGLYEFIRLLLDRSAKRNYTSLV